MNTLQILRDNVDECINADGVFEPSDVVLDRVWGWWMHSNSPADLVGEAINGDNDWASLVVLHATLQFPSDSNKLRRETIDHFRTFARTLAEEHAAEIEQYHREVNAPDPMDDVGRMIG